MTPVGGSAFSLNSYNTFMNPISGWCSRQYGKPLAVLGTKPAGVEQWNLQGAKFMI
jgi:hypothetical protein